MKSCSFWRLASVNCDFDFFLSDSWFCFFSFKFYCFLFDNFIHKYNTFYLFSLLSSLSYLCFTSLLSKSLFHIHGFCVVSWLAEFNLSHLCDHEFGAIHWSLVSSPVGFHLKAANAPPQNPSIVSSSAERETVWQADTGANSPILTPSELAHRHPHQWGQLSCAAQVRKGPVLLPNAAASEGQGQLYASLSSLFPVVTGVAGVNRPPWLTVSGPWT